MYPLFVHSNECTTYELVSCLFIEYEIDCTATHSVYCMVYNTLIFIVYNTYYIVYNRNVEKCVESGDFVETVEKTMGNVLFC